MNGALKMGIVAAGSFALGYVISNERNEVYYLNEAQKMTEALESENEKIVKGLMKEIRDLKDQVTDAKLDPAVDEFAEGDPSEVEVAAEAALVDYQGGTRDYYAHHKQIADEVQQPKAEAPPINHSIVITEEQYRMNELGYEQHSLMYYSRDNVLAMVDDTVVDGEARKQILGPYDPNDPQLWEVYEALFLRNEELAQEFEIDYMPSSFAEEAG